MFSFRFLILMALILPFSLPCLAGEQELVSDMVPGDGKVFIRSEPSGADIFVKKGDELLRTKVKTPGVINPPKGKTIILVRLDGHDEGNVTVEVGEGFAKPDVVKLLKKAGKPDKPAHSDISTGDDFDWQVFIDGKPAVDVNGRTAKTPCSIVIPEGARVIAVAKEGYIDQRTYVPQGKSRIEFLRRPMKGQSRLLTKNNLKQADAAFNPVGKWKRDWKTVEFTLTADGKFFVPNTDMRGAYTVKDGFLALDYGSVDKRVPIRSYKILDNNTLETEDLQVYAGRKVNLIRQ